MRVRQLILTRPPTMHFVLPRHNANRNSIQLLKVRLKKTRKCHQKQKVGPKTIHYGFFRKKCRKSQNCFGDVLSLLFLCEGVLNNKYFLNYVQTYWFLHKRTYSRAVLGRRFFAKSTEIILPRVGNTEKWTTSRIKMAEP